MPGVVGVLTRRFIIALALSAPISILNDGTDDKDGTSGTGPVELCADREGKVLLLLDDMKECRVERWCVDLDDFLLFIEGRRCGGTAHEGTGIRFVSCVTQARSRLGARVLAAT